MNNFLHTQMFQSRLTGAAEAATGSAYARKPMSGEPTSADIEALATRLMR